ncbi:hypothetical protein Poli38472_013384 [Pythium oligandrum]|uniref:Uncharacterized protein n=1 Tax=Pythium oligandrum TaxID=41045 RepID=A0A8K1C7K4_PYTOL|nr:hypothetical protein Poli38472_013384 [Pythium oligandrum]|eukprot:TMW57910.1 hypothetical protein Poli38472_013384 [Pythium oligandrum]
MWGSPEPSIPSLAPVAAPLTEAEKVVRQRLHVKRTYYRKLNQLQTLRDQVRQLEGEYEQLIGQKRLQEAVALLTDGSNGHLEDPLQTKMEQYTELLDVKERLRKQNDAMRDVLEEFEHYAHKLQKWMEVDDVSAGSSGDELVSAERVPDFTARLSTIVIPRLRTPITVNVCHEIARRTFEEMQIFRQSHGFLSTGMSVFGWRDKRLRDGDRVKFSLKKLFHGYPALTLSLHTWNVMSSARQFPTLYSASLNVKMFTVQHVDEDNVICFRVIPSPDGLTLIKSLFLIARFATQDGLVVLLRSIDQSLLAPYQNPPGVREQWVDYYTWVTFDRAGDQGQHCQIDFGGEIKSTAVVGSDAWMLEVLLVALRWENRVIGPVFSIQQSEEDEEMS